MKKTYLILAHAMPNHLFKLVNTLNNDDSIFYIHIDKKADLADFNLISHIHNVFIIPERFDCIWGDYSIVEAIISLLKHYIRNEHSGSHAILLSGQDYPLVSNESINNFFNANISKSFIDCMPLSHANMSEEDQRKRFNYFRLNLGSGKSDALFIPSINSDRILDDFNFNNLLTLLTNNKINKNSKIDYIRLISNIKNFPKESLHVGKQWFALNRYLVIKILDYINSNSDYVNYSKYCHVPDEFFFHSIVKTLQFQDDRIILGPSVTYNNWNKPNVPLPVVFNVSDFEELKKFSNYYLFARKFSEDSSTKLIELLDELRGQNSYR